MGESDELAVLNCQVVDKCENEVVGSVGIAKLPDSFVPTCEEHRQQAVKNLEDILLQSGFMRDNSENKS